jgi:hypothetical protein
MPQVLQTLGVFFYCILKTLEFPVHETWEGWLLAYFPFQASFDELEPNSLFDV